MTPGETEVWFALSKVFQMVGNLIVHLPDNMLIFGPASTFNAERCESLNGTIRARNIYANHHTQSKDIIWSTGWSTAVSSGKATVVSYGQIVNVGDFVHYSAQCWSLDASGTLSKLLSDDKGCYCIVQHLDPLMVGTTPQLNHFDCPLFTPTNILRVLPSVIVLVSVSVIHKCNPTCILKEKTAETRLERQSVTQKTLCCMIGLIPCIATCCFAF
ncbi:hypothetical protein EMCRGX_G005896 [Ephydatia muelleri]